MIGTSTSEYIFIRLCIFLLTWATPFCILYCLASRVLPISHYRPPWFLDAFALAETLFYFGAYLPRKCLLQAPVNHPPLPQNERHRLFKLCLDNIPDPQTYQSKWFWDAPNAEVKRENVKQFLRWAFFSNKLPDQEEDEELDGYVAETERVFGTKLEPGKGSAQSMTLSINPVDMLHRGLVWYMCVGFVDSLTSIRMFLHSFRLYRTSIRQTLSIFPPRPLSLLASHRSPGKTVSYWYRPHLSRRKLPVLFIHGIGIGLYPYVTFLSEMNQEDRSDGDDGQVGIIALELMPISFRITHAALRKEHLCREIRQILAQHGWDQYVLVSHSYGSVVSTHLLKTPGIAEQIKALVLIDPITFLLHLPDVAYNFTYRKPSGANEHQLYYFASSDVAVSHTLSRRFFWFENILWKQDLQDKPVTVSLAGKDLILDSHTVWDYLNNKGFWSQSAGRRSESVEGESTGDHLDVLWFKDLDHAQVFDRKSTRQRLARVVMQYCAMGPAG